MADIDDYDYKERSDALLSVIKQFPEGSEEGEVLQLAAHLLLYVYCDRKRLRAFRQWRAEGDLPASQVPFNALHEFATQEEADAWRASGQATDGDRIIIAGQGYEVVDVPPYGLKFRWVPLPAQLAAWEAEEEDPSEP